MKPDLQKPTSTSSFSGLFFALKIESNIGAKIRIPDPETYH